MLAETTANTLALTLAELASNSEAQDWVYNSIKRVLGDREPVSLNVSCLLSTHLTSLLIDV